MRLPPDAWRLGCFNDEDMPDYLIMRSNEDRFRDFQKQHRDRLNKHFYITVVPNTLDVLECCLTFLPRSLCFFLILNGLARWEQEFLDRVYPNIPKFTLTTYRGCILYERVLDMLMECNDLNFGIIDQDCFVLDSDFFLQLQISDNEFAVSPFTSVNRQANITFPRTYFLLFNTKIIHHIRKQYELSFKHCWSIPSRLEQQLSGLKLGYHNFPHDSLNYFDNFQLIWAMAFHHGFSFGAGPPSSRRLPGVPQYRIVHVGAAASYLTEEFRDYMMQKHNKYELLSKLEKEKFRAAAFSYYAHLLLLENTKNSELKDRYGPFFSPLGLSETILDTFGSVISPHKVKEMDLVIERLRKTRSTCVGGQQAST
jgi:hypothetical protein